MEHAANVETNETDAFDAVIVGAGFSGLGMAGRLRHAGCQNILILDKNAEIGGTWFENTYPGAACDVPSSLYSLSFGPPFSWSRKYAGQAEIHEYLEACCDRFGVRAHLRLNTTLLAADFDAATGLWTLTVDTGGTIETRALILACGQLNAPSIPSIAGIEDFKGRVFHSARWPDDFDASGRCIGLVGSGASAIQIVPALANRAAHVLVFQRSAGWVLPKGDRPHDETTRALRRALPALQWSARIWTYLQTELRALAFTRYRWMLAPLAAQARGLLRRATTCPVKYDALLPRDAIGCKRILLSDTWHKAIARSNVTVVDNPIGAITEDSVTTMDGAKHICDTLVFATGFQTRDPFAAIAIKGLDGQLLSKTWAQGATAYNGTCVAGFPNLFILYGPNTNLAHTSVLLMIEAQIEYVLRILRELRDRRARFVSVAVSRQAQDVTHLDKKLATSVWNLGCRSWYKSESGRITANWPGFAFTFRRRLRRARLTDLNWVGSTTPS